MEKKIVWTRIAINHLDQIHQYVFNTAKSQAMADSVVRRVYNSVGILSKDCEIYKPDIYKSFNDGSYRAYEVFHYRISYRITGNEVYILAVRHTSRNPELY